MTSQVLTPTTHLHQIFAGLGPQSCPYHYNFHLHTNCSDGQLRPEAVIDQALELGLKGLAITDHHTIRGYQQAQAYLQQVDRTLSLGLQLWLGMEVTAYLCQTEVHILAYSFAPEHPSLLPYLLGQAPLEAQAEAAVVVAAVHQAGGLAVLAHPSRYRVPAQELIPAAAALGIDGVETYYAYGNPDPWQTSPRETQLVLAQANLYQLLSTCGTDSHGKSLLRRM